MFEVLLFTIELSHITVNSVGLDLVVVNLDFDVFDLPSRISCPVKVRSPHVIALRVCLIGRS